MFTLMFSLSLTYPTILSSTSLWYADTFMIVFMHSDSRTPVTGVHCRSASDKGTKTEKAKKVIFEQGPTNMKLSVQARRGKGKSNSSLINRKTKGE